MVQIQTGVRRLRKSFGKIREVASMPNLIEVQKASYDQFLMVQEPSGGRGGRGLQMYNGLNYATETRQAVRTGEQRKRDGTARALSTDGT